MGKAIWQGKSEIDELQRIFKVSKTGFNFNLLSPNQAADNIFAFFFF